MSSNNNKNLKSFNEIIKEDLSFFFIDNITARVTPSIKDIDEVSLYDYEAKTDRDFFGKATDSSLEILGDIQPGEILHGVPIIEGEIKDLLGQDNFGAVDGSSGRVVRHYLSVVLAKAAFGSYSYNDQLPLTEEISNATRYVLGWDGILKRNLSSTEREKIVRLNTKLPRRESVNTVATKLQSVLEIEAIPEILKRYGSDLTYLGIDGPLYQRSLVEAAIGNIQKVIDKGLRVFAIVKRSEDNAFYLHLKTKYEKHSVLKHNFQHWCHSDREFFGFLLKPGYRTPFYLHENKHEKNSGIPVHLRRVCTWIKLNSNKVCRVELPLCQASIEDDLAMAEDLISIIYLLSKINGNKLPVQFDRADQAAMIKETESDNQSILIDQFLRNLGLAYGDQEDWK